MPSAPHASKPRRPGPSGPPNEGWIWGAHAAKAALENQARTVLEALVTRNAQRAHDLHDPRLTLVEPKAIDSVLPGGAVHQGVALRTSALEPVALEDVIARPGFVVVLDQVTDPHNVGAIVRSAAAFGAAGLVLQDRKAPPFFGACAKAAVGAVERTPHARVVNIARAIDALRAAGRHVVGLAGEASEPLEAALNGSPPDRLALALGSEDKGLRPSVAEACDRLARIPIAQGVESLNVSNAAAVAFYAAARNCDPVETVL